LSYQELPGGLLHDEYQEVAAPFKASLDRLMSFAELPLQLIYWSARLSIVKYVGRYRSGVSPEDSSRDREPQVSKAIGEAFEEAVSRHIDPIGMASGTLGTMVGDIGSHPIEAACEGIEAIFAAMVMASYAAFETLAADLWVAAVNRHHRLATNWVEKNPGKELSPKILSDYSFDVSSRMGTVLHTTKKVSFESLGDIRAAYNQAFKGELNDAFDANLTKAEKTRHLFAHRGGLVDQKFKSDMRDHSEYDKIVIGERLRLIGPVTGSHVTACAKSGVNLLKDVDKWSAMHS
jgi:hypothetical protein